MIAYMKEFFKEFRTALDEIAITFLFFTFFGYNNYDDENEKIKV